METIGHVYVTEVEKTSGRLEFSSKGRGWRRQGT